MAGSTATLPRGTPPGLPLRVAADDRLVRLAAQGNERAFAMIYERHSQPLYRYCRSIVRNDHDAQDVLQTTMTRALAALRKGPPDAPLRPWLFRIAHNEAISLLRAKKPTSELDEAASMTGPSVEGRAEERARLAQLIEDLADLPDRQRSALVMRELSGLSHDEIATALDVSLSGAKQSIFEARVGLQEFEKGRAMQCAEIQQIISDADGRKLRGRPVRAHLRSCAECRGMREAIGRRRDDFAALAPPLPAAAGAAILAKVFGGGGGSIGGGGVFAAGAATTAGKAGSMALGAKLAAGAAVVAVAGAGTPVLVDHLDSAPSKPTSSPPSALPAAGSTPAAPLPAAAQQGLTTAAAAVARTATTAASASATHAATPARAVHHGRGGAKGAGASAAGTSNAGGSSTAAAHRKTTGSAASSAAKQRRTARKPSTKARRTAAPKRPSRTSSITRPTRTTAAPARGNDRAKKEAPVSTVTTPSEPTPATTASDSPRAIPPRK